MKKVLLFVFAVMLTFYVSAQTIVFQENFELPTIGLTTTADSGGFPTTSFHAWSASTNLFKSGVKADSNVVQTGKIIYLTSGSFATTGNSYVILEFAQICKLYVSDGGTVEVSIDGGTTWTILTLAQYLGTGNMLSNGTKFCDNSYSTDWVAGVNAIPTNAWWKNEKFDISSIAANQANVKIRFKYLDSGNPSGLGRYGWLLDDIKVTASPSELNPPVITMIAYPTDTVYHGGPYNISAYVKDPSGIDTVFVMYKIGNGAFTQLGMVKSPTIDSLYSAGIPYVGYGKIVTYNITAKDASSAHNMVNKPLTGYYSFYTKYNSGGPVIIGTTTTNQPYPFKSNADYTKSVSLYKATDVNRFGLITQLKWNVSTAQATVNIPIKIYIKQIPATSMTADSWDNLINGAVLVYDGTQSFITTGWKTIDLTTSFNYNSGSLMVLCEANNGTAALVTPSFQYHAGTTGTHQYFASSTIYTGVLSTSRPNITIGFVAVPLPTQDAGISQITNPIGSVIAGTAFPLDVKVKNFGSSLLTKANVFYTVDGGSPISIAWTGSLQTDSSIVYNVASLNLAVGIHALKVWTNLPNDSADQNYMNDTANFSFYACAGPLSGTYTVGGVGANFSTFADVYTGLSQCGISGPVVFNINAGIYSDQLTIPEVAGASAINTLTFKSATNDSTSVIMNHTSTSTANWIVKLLGADFITIKNIKFAPADSLYSTAIVMTNGATNNKLIGNLFVGYGGVAVSQTLITVEGTVLANAWNLIQGNYLIKGSYGISIKGTAAVKLKNTIVKNNTLENNAVYGIYAQYVDSTLIDSNTVNSSVVNTASKYGIYLQNGNVLNKITKNTVILTGGTNMYGILAETCVSSDTTKGLIANNFVSVVDGSNFAYGIRLNTVTKFKVYANSVITNGNNSSDTRALNVVSSSSGIDLKNNNLQSNKFPIYIEGTTSVIASNYNNYFSTGTTFAYWNTTSYPNLAALVAASLKDSNSVSVNPYFFSLTNLHTFNGLLKGMGTNLTEVTTDIDGAPRLNPPCIGADEFLPPSQDATLISILKPIGGCALTTTEDVTVVIKNVGSDIILPNTMTARYYLDTINAVVSELVNRTLNPGDTIQYVFATKANIAVSPVTLNDTSYKVRAWTDLTGDYAHANDSSSVLTIASLFMPAAPTVTNGSTLYATSLTLNAVSNRPIVWYDSIASTNILHTGASFTTPLLFATDTFYVASKTSMSFNAAIGTGTSSQTYPFYTNYGYTRSASIYQASEVGSYGVINQIKWNVATSSTLNVPIKIYLAQTTQSSMTADTWSNLISNATLVYDGTKMFDVTGWSSVNLSSSYNYSSGNLMVLTESNVGGGGSSPIPYFQYSTAGSNSHQYFYQDTSPPISTGYLSTYRPNIILSGNVAGCISARVPIVATVVVPAREAGISAIVAPTGCALYQVPVSVKIFNHGSDILNSTNTTVKYKLDNGSYITPEALNITINPFDTATFTFTTLANFTAPTVDRFIKVTAVVITPGDAIHLNDTLIKDSILSRFTPPAPTANNVNVFYGDHATLTATATNGNIVWFDQLLGGNSIGQGSPFTTSYPIYQYPADTFYVEANTSYSAAATIGTGTATNTTTGYPAPYGNYYWGAKHQILITQAELISFGFQAGPITSLAFDVATTQGVPLQNFEIKMGHTTNTAMAIGNWVSGLTPVYSVASYTEVTGWNTHSFTTPFVWNGVDNVVAEICFNNSSYTYNALTRYTPTTFNSVAYRNNDEAIVCTNPASASVSMNRPNMQINGMVPGCSSTPRVPVIVTVSPPPQNDAGVTALINPVGSTPSGISTPIKVKIKNYGQANLTSVAVAWTLNGVAQTVYNFTGNLPTGSDSTITIANLTFSGGLYCVKAWTEHPNAAAIDSVASNDTLGTTCFTACLNGIYTIGTTSTANTNFLTFNAAVSTLKVAGVCGSVTFLVDTGTYNEQVRIPEIAGASAVNTITFRSASNDSTKVILQYNATASTNFYTLLLDSADYITVKGITIKATGASYGIGVETRSNATNNIISNCSIEMTPGANYSIYGIYDYGSASCFNTYQNNLILNGYYGIYNYGNGSTTLKPGNKIIGNKILNFYYYGIYSYYQDSVQIIGNELNSNVTNTYIYGLYTYYNQNASKILKNKIILSTPGTQYGLYVYYMTGTATAHGLVANNMVALSGGNATSTNYGMYVYSSNYQDIYYNSVSITVPSLSYGRALYHYGGTFINFVDNNFVNTGGGMAAYISTPAAINVSDYNNLYTSGSILGYWNANVNTLADWQLASTKDAHSVSIDPLFTSATDLHLLSTGLSVLGTPVAGITEDIDGFLRDPLFPTIGADEVPLLQHDAGVTFISRPASVETEATTFPVKVVIKNFGTDPITSVLVTYILNGGTPVAYTFTPTLPIASLDTVSVTFPANMTVVAGNNNICAFTTLAGDINTFNNQKCKNFWGTPLYDAQLAAILPMPEGCGLTLDTVKIIIVNQGIMPINGGLTASYQRLWGGPIVTETVSTAIPVGGNFTYVFNALTNVAVTTADSLYKIKSWVTLTNDNIPYNNLDTIFVSSLHTPMNPVTANVSIPYATTASLNATSPTNDPLKWYDVLFAGTGLYTGNPFVSPILFTTDTFYVEANSAYSALATIGSGTATNTSTGFPSPYGNYWWGAKHQILITKAELNAYGIQAGPINSLAFDVAVNGGAPLQNFEIKIGHTATAALATGVYATNLTSVYTNPSYTDVVGWNTHVFSSPFVWNGTDNVLIETCFNNSSYTTCAQMRYTPTTFNSVVYSSGDNATNCSNLSSSSVSMNRPNIRLLGMVPGCSSQRLPVIVTVGAQPALDASAVTMLKPVTGVNLTATDTVKVLVKNYGYSSISNFQMSYKKNSNPTVTEPVTLTTPLAMDSTMVYTFIQTVDLSSNMQPDTSKIMAWVSLTGDPTHQNDTTKKTLINLPPVYCLSTASYNNYDDIGNVTFAGINHGNPLPVLTNPTAINMYSNYIDSVGIMATVQPGMTYPISLSAIFQNTSISTTSEIKVYIDYNRNGNWDLPEELAFTSPYNGSTQSTVTGNITIPYTALPGYTRIRIVADRYGLAPPCATYSYGETEDYKISIIPPIPHDGGISKLGTGTFVPYTASNPVSSYFYIRNYGSDSLTSANINYTVNGGVVSSYPWTPSTLAVQTLDVDSVHHPLTLQYGMNTIKAYTNGITGDVNYNNDTLNLKVFKEYSTTPPYADNFEVNKYWFATDTANGAPINNLWQQGIPVSSSPALNAVHSPVNAWVTKLSGNYPINNVSILYTPVFDIATMIPDTLKFWQWRQFGAGATGKIQYKNYNGDWIPCDTIGTNWYNANAAACWTGIDTTWKQSTFCVKNLVTATLLGTTVQFRFVFASSASTPVMKGWAIDDFELTLASIPNDGGVIAITSPSATSSVGDNVTVAVTVKNFGTDPLINIPVKYQVGTASVQTATLAGPLAPGATQSFSFTTQPFQVGVQSYTIRAYTAVLGDIYTQNDATIKSVTVIPALNDVGVIDIILPGDTIGMGGTSPVKVVIKNYGSQTQTAFSIGYQRGTQPAVEVIWTGNLASGATTQFEFPNPMTIPSGSSFSLASYTKMVNDAYVHNDTVIRSIQICNVGKPGTISGLSSLNAGTNNVMYRFAGSVTGAVHYNWYYSGNDVHFNYDFNNKDTVYLDYGPAATSGILSVKAWNGICEGNASELTILIGVDIDDVNGSNFWLGQNMPNPTTGLTNVEYSLPTSGDVKFDILNLFGQKVYSFNQKMDAGKHFIDLNVNDLSAGVYYYTLEFKDKRLVKKMVVTK